MRDDQLPKTNYEVMHIKSADGGLRGGTHEGEKTREKRSSRSVHISYVMERLNESVFSGSDGDLLHPGLWG